MAEAAEGGALPELLIVGSGAMACLFGARLAPHAQLTMLGGWPEGVQALRQDGIRVEGGGPAVRVRATAEPADCAGAHLALVLVKAYQTEGTADRLADCLAPDGLAVTLQNGLGNLERLQARLGERRAAAGVTTSGATLLGPGRIRPGGEGRTWLARQERLQPLADLLGRGGFTVDWADDVEALLWGKAVVNAAINPLAALLRVPNGALIEPARPQAQSLLAEAAREAAAVAAARGVRLPFADAAAQALEVARRTAANRSSMLQDVERGRRTEIEAINGAIAAEGGRLGVPAPVNQTLWRLVASLSPEAEGHAHTDHA